ncbi:MAG: 3'-5' exonuclease [Betaproteobacteria bacterium]|nr:3'-5' exonuclease [Betaproteobacteria bacterium]
MTPTLVFDIETVPDVAGLRVILDLDPGLSDNDVAEIAFQRRRAQTGSDFLQVHLQRVVAISCAMREGATFRVWSIGMPEDDERTLIQRFFDGVEKFTPQLVSWNGGGFDLPVLHYRGLIHGVVAAKYWDMGEDDRDFKYNNYISRYHSRHLDLMDLLALYQPRNNMPLDQLAKLLGLPGKLGMDGSKVWEAYRQGAIGSIRDYCETDVVNTHLAFVQFQKMRGVFDETQFAAETALVRSALGKLKGEHWREFLAAWGPRAS